MRGSALTTLLFLSLLFSSSSSQQAGMQVLLQRTGLQKVAQLITDLWVTELQDQHLPDIKDEGVVSFKLTNIKIENFATPSIGVRLSRTAGVITLSASIANFLVKGNWWFRETASIFHLTDSGGFALSLSGVSVSVSIRLGMESAGHLTARSAGCNCDIGNASVDIHGNPLDWLYNLLSKAIEGNVESELEEQICKDVLKAVDGNLNDELSEIKVKNVEDNMILDWTLVSAPHIEQDYVRTLHKAEFVSARPAPRFPGVPDLFPAAQLSPRMITIMVSDYVINSYAFIAYSQGTLRVDLAKDTLPPDSLRTTCDPCTFCMGTFFPELRKRYPDTEGVLSVSATEAPLVRTTPTQTILSCKGELVLNFPTPSGQMETFLTLALSADIPVTAFVDGNTIKAKVTTFRPIVRVKQSLADALFQSVFDFYLKDFIIQNLNDLGDVGINLPHIRNSRSINTIIKHYKGGITLGTDVEPFTEPDTPYPPTPAPRPTKRPPPSTSFPCRKTLSNRTPTTSRDQTSAATENNTCFWMRMFFNLCFFWYVLWNSTM